MENASNNTPKSTARKTLTLSKGAVARPKEFWTCWAHGRRRPRARHDSEAAALAEALRIAENEPGLVVDIFRMTFAGRRVVKS
jgi:hypothetical protein